MQQSIGRMAHIPSLDGVRAASILLVLAGHTLPLGFPAWQLNAVAATSGMALFFCLSGFLIVSILHHDPDVGRFLTKRLVRIVPAVFLFLTVLLAFFGLPLDAYVKHLLFISNYATDALSQGPTSHLWSLCVEVHFYLAMAALALILGRNAVWLVPPAALVFTGIRVVQDAGININTHLRVDEILVGGCLALVAIHKGAELRRWLSDARRAMAAILLFATLLAVSSHPYGGPMMFLRPYFAMLLVGAVIHSRLPYLHDILEGRIAAYIARISYALYIWHPLMVSGVMNTGTLAERYLMKRPVSYVLTWAAAHLSTYYWEQRWQRAGRTYLARRA